MNFTKEKLPLVSLENKDVLQIKDPFILGIYVFLKMEMQQGEYTVPAIIDRMTKQFAISEANVLRAFKIIIEDLGLITMIQKKT